MFSHIPWSSSEDENLDEESQSLTSILETPQQRSDLTLLIANCTASMRKKILDSFDPKQTGEKDDIIVELTGDDTLENPKVYPSRTDDEEIGEQEQKLKEREEELSGPKMQGLKDAALVYFDEWRDKLLQRVGEVVNSREIAIAQKKEAKPTSTSMRFRMVATTHGKDVDIAKVYHELYPPTSTSLAQFNEAHRALILHSMLLLLLSLENYSAHSRILLLHLTSSLNLPHSFLTEDEDKVARGLLKAAEQMTADEETKKKAEENSTARKWKVGIAGVAGAAIIGVTGGLAAPLLAAGIGSVMGGLGLGATAAAGYLGTLASSSVIVGGIFGAYGARMTGQMMDQYAKEVSDFGFEPINRHNNAHKIEKEYRRLRIAIGISGWLTEKEEVVIPWRVIGQSIEGFALRFELESLMSLGNAITLWVKSAAWSYAKGEIIKRTVFGALTAGLWPLGLLKVSRVVDNPFSVAKHRSDKAGQVLADALINKAQGERPVTLVGYSLGARVIYSCLSSLAERKAFGLVESVVLLGAPAPSAAGDWRKMRSVVSGRLVNVFSTNDYVLAFLYRTSSIQYGIAGLQKVEGVPGVENIDVSELVSGHLRYRYLTGSILKKIGFEDIDMKEVEKEEAALAAAEEQEMEVRKEERVEEKDPDKEREELEEEVKKKNEESMLSWATGKLTTR
ncbi:DUF726-domain-containing protein [Patellaria atrata CBS 101060]|uniref:DUF726-domain-containing protein n=1 Tax=Patellaria atrata CBS 101060 TaxID=1346257 RepID=A0A9P4S1M9_9PEZI|nr:DUF726-domain-containing protein [Patellaria atrata CBS 101060]